MRDDGRRLFLRVGEEVHHLAYPHWGVGRVLEVKTSDLPGGTALVRIEFTDGEERTFGNDLDQQTCCYYFGVRRFYREETRPPERQVAGTRVARPALPAPRRRRNGTG
jgi:hypothetical protein